MDRIIARVVARHLLAYTQYLREVHGGELPPALSDEESLSQYFIWEAATYGDRETADHLVAQQARWDEAQTPVQAIPIPLVA